VASGNEKQRVGVGVAVVIGRETPTGREVLLVQRRYHGAGSWSTVGGYIDPGESPEASCRREALEETGVAISEPMFACVTNDIHDDGKHNVTLWFTADALNPAAELRVSEESLAAGWFAWDALPEPIYRSFGNYLAGPTWPAVAERRRRMSGRS
jgi:ADP-ribose pyrophosphatase YjhB (NUDIX family)